MIENSQQPPRGSDNWHSIVYEYKVNKIYWNSKIIIDTPSQRLLGNFVIGSADSEYDIVNNMWWVFVDVYVWNVNESEPS